MEHDYWNEIRHLESAYNLCRKAIMSRYQLSAIEVDVLLFLANNPQYDTASDISAIRRIPKSHVSLAVSLLHRKNYLHKSADKTNRKRIHLVLTEQAAEVTAFGIGRQEAYTAALTEGFSPAETEQLKEFLKRIADNLYRYEELELQKEEG